MAEDLKSSTMSAFSVERFEITDALNVELARAMNAIHATTFSNRFWKIVLHPYVNAAVTRKSLLDNFTGRIAPEFEAINGFRLPSKKERVKAGVLRFLRSVKNRGAYDKVHSVLSTQDHVTYGLPAIDEVKNELGSSLPSCYTVLKGTGSRIERQRGALYAKNCSDLYYRNVINGIPRIYVEYFRAIYDAIKLYTPERKIFHVSNLNAPFDSILVAKYVEHGARLNYYQHGGYYGELIGHNAHYHENSIADEFRTWGWKLRDRDVPWKAYRLESFRQKYANVTSKPVYDFLLCFSPIVPHNRKRMESDTSYFLTNISSDRYSKILARPRPVSRVFSSKSDLNFIKDSRVTIDSGLGSMPEAVSKSKLIIQFSYPSTNFMECLYVDHPTIAILKNDQPTDIVRPYYEFFLQEKVFHMSFASLVEHLNTVDIEEWWRGLIRKPMYAQFKHEFLRKV